MKTLQIQLLVLSLIFFSSCIHLLDDHITIVNVLETDVVAPADFDWNTTRTVKVEILVETSDATLLKSKISVFSADPLLANSLVSSGSASDRESYSSVVNVPSYVTDMYVQCEFPSGEKRIVEVNVSDDQIYYVFTESSAKKVYLKSASISPNCTDGVDETISGTVENVTIERNKTVCITGSLVGTVSFKGDGGVLRICGDAYIREFKVSGKPKVAIEVTEDGILTCRSLSLNNDDRILQNWGSLTLTKNFSISGTIENYGVAVMEGLSLNSGGTFLNTGTCTNTESLENNSNVINSGFLEVKGHLNNNGKASFINKCQLIVSESISQNAALVNSGYIYCGKDFTFNNSDNILIGGSMISSVDMTINAEIVGTDGYSSLEISHDTKINGKGKLSGYIDICDEDGIENKYGSIASTVTFCDLYLATSECNPTGIGEPKIVDSDNDGVVDNLDDYPMDAQRAFNSYFPGKGTSASYVFEDLWPSRGDYDFNDLVVGFDGMQVMNADNMVVELIVNLNVKAIGASNANGFGFQFDNIFPSEIESIDGVVLRTSSTIANASNGTEMGQDKAVIIAIEDVEDVVRRVGGSMFNTVDNGLVGESNEVSIRILFGENSAIDPSRIQLSSLNVFLFRSDDRGLEIHLADMKPTDMMDLPFGLSDDTSEPSEGRYFRSVNNLPWALMMLESFKYPQERVPLSEAYPEFADWAQSGGIRNLNWYTKPSSGQVWNR